MGDTSLLNNVKFALKSIVISSPHVMTVNDLKRDYKKLEGINIPYEKLGFPSLESFLNSISEALEIDGSGPMAKVYARKSKKTAHITQMLSNQKNVDRSLKRIYKYSVEEPLPSCEKSNTSTISSKSSGVTSCVPTADKHLISVAKVEPLCHSLPKESTKINLKDTAKWEQGMPINSTESRNSFPLRQMPMTSAPVFLPRHNSTNNSLINTSNIPHQFQCYNVPSYQTFLHQYDHNFAQNPFHGQYLQYKNPGHVGNYSWNYNIQKNYVSPNAYYFQNCAVPNFIPQDQVYPNTYFRNGNLRLPPGLPIKESILNERSNIDHQENKDKYSSNEIANANITKEFNSLHITEENMNITQNNEMVISGEESSTNLKNEHLIRNESRNSSVLTISSTESAPRNITSKISESKRNALIIEKDVNSKWKNCEISKKTHSPQNQQSAVPKLSDDDITFLFDFPPDTVIYGQKILAPEIPKGIEVGRSFPLFVIEVHNPYKFWFHFYKKDHELDDLMHNLQTVYNYLPLEELQMQKNHIKREQTCATIYQNLWHRAEIISFNVKEDEVVVFFFDYGTVSTVKRRDIKYLLKEFSTLPHQAFRGCLSQIKPVSTRWSRDATISFMCCVRDIPLFAMPTEIDYEEKIIYMTLADTTRDKTKDFQINESLIHKGYAKYDSNFRGSHSKKYQIF